MTRNKKNIYCPKCGKKVAVYDGRATMNIESKCKKCKKLIVFYPETGETKYRNMPARTTGSGLRLY